MIRRANYVILFLFVGIPALFWGQTTTGKAKTSGVCSPAVSGGANTFTINCAVNEEDGQKMLDILNKILAKQADLDTISAKLDEILKALPTPLPPPTVTYCPSYDSERRQTTITIKTNGQIPRPFFAFFFDGPVGDGGAELSNGGSFGYSHARADKMPNPERSAVIRVSTINFATSSWFPGDGPIKVKVPSDARVHLLKLLVGGGDDPDGVFQENLIVSCN